MKQIYNYISNDSKTYAQIHIEKIQTLVSSLTQTPLLGRKVPEVSRSLENYRELILGNYRIIYRIDQQKNKLRIITLLHSSRLLKNAL